MLIMTLCRKFIGLEPSKKAFEELQCTRTCALSGIKVMPKAIDERLIMKIEVAEVLYSDWAYILRLASNKTCLLS